MLHRLTVLVWFLPWLALAETANWPQFRGPTGDGHSDAKRLPIAWSPTNNVKWKTPVHGKGWSCPVVWGRQVWMTTATPDGHQLFVVCLDRDTGQVLLDRKMYDIDKPQICHEVNSYASPTPVIEKGRVYISFGSPGTACINTRTFETVWERRDIPCDHYRGAASSPILHGKNSLIMAYDGIDHQSLVCFDKRTGQTKWQTRRSVDYKDLEPDGKPKMGGDLRKAYGTAHVIRWQNRDMILSQGAMAMYGYDPEDGRELWRVDEHTSHSGGTRPVFGHGLMFIPTGWSNGQILAIRPGAGGESLDANSTSEGNVSTIGKNGLQVVWRTKRNVPKKPSLTLDGDYLYGIGDNGVANCWDAKTGEIKWSERIGGNYSAAPLLASGHLYFFSEEGKTTVVAASPTFNRIAESQLPDGFMASPAVTGNNLILRTRTHVYCIGK